ncbi:MAG: flagellin, partial [Luminiphilus sp.]|nr:flagellin [Luminiphilus sp.]
FDGVTLVAGDTVTADTYAAGDTFDGVRLEAGAEEKTGFYVAGDTFDGVVLSVGGLEQASNLIQVDFGNLVTDMATLSTSDILTVATAQSAVGGVDDGVTSVSEKRAAFGAASNQLIHSIDNLNSIKNAASASRSRILDTDYARATSELAAKQIIQQAGNAMLAQANQLPQSVLTLLE